jgi:hypothetical protein
VDWSRASNLIPVTLVKSRDVDKKEISLAKSKNN